MIDIEFYTLECMEKLDEIGIEYGNILEVTVNTRAKNRWGQCRKVPGGYKININAALLDENISEDGLINTLFHELLHSCDGCMNHGPEWKRLAFKVYLATGQNIKRTSSAAEKGLEVTVRNKEFKYIFKCECCGQIIRRQKTGKFVQYYNHYKCGRCGGEFERIK